MNTSEKTTQLVGLLRAYLDEMGKPNTKVEIDDSIDMSMHNESITVAMPDIGVYVDVGTEVEVKAIGGHRAPGYRVFFMKLCPGNRMNPDEYEDLTYLETVSMPEALAGVGRYLADQVANQLWLSRMPEYDADGVKVQIADGTTSTTYLWSGESEGLQREGG